MRDTQTFLTFISFRLWLFAYGVNLGGTKNAGHRRHGAVGSLEELALFAEHTGKHWIAGKRQLHKIYH